MNEDPNAPLLNTERRLPLLRSGAPLLAFNLVTDTLLGVAIGAAAGVAVDAIHGAAVGPIPSGNETTVHAINKSYDYLIHSSAVQAGALAGGATGLAAGSGIVGGWRQRIATERTAPPPEAPSLG